MKPSDGYKHSVSGGRGTPILTTHVSSRTRARTSEEKHQEPSTPPRCPRLSTCPCLAHHTWTSPKCRKRHTSRRTRRRDRHAPVILVPLLPRSPSQVQASNAPSSDPPPITFFKLFFCPSRACPCAPVFLATRPSRSGLPWQPPIDSQRASYISRGFPSFFSFPRRAKFHIPVLPASLPSDRSVGEQLCCPASLLYIPRRIFFLAPPKCLVPSLRRWRRMIPAVSDWLCLLPFFASSSNPLLLAPPGGRLRCSQHSSGASLASVARVLPGPLAMPSPVPPSPRAGPC